MELDKFLDGKKGRQKKKRNKGERIDWLDPE
jgi:hypothetical protein